MYKYCSLPLYTVYGCAARSTGVTTRPYCTGIGSPSRAMACGVVIE